MNIPIGVLRSASENLGLLHVLVEEAQGAFEGVLGGCLVVAAPVITVETVTGAGV